MTKVFFGGQRSKGKGYKKLNKDDVLRIRRMIKSGEYSREEVMKKYSISKSTYYNISNRKTWKDS